jgi:hypothetical protein
MEESTRESEFERNRETLLNQYHSENIPHSGFVIALIIGVFILVANYKDFFNDGAFAILIFYLIFSMAISLGFYIIGRLIYWTELSNSVLILSEKQFNKLKSNDQDDHKINKELHLCKELSDIAYLQAFGKKRIKGFIAKSSVLRLVIYSLLVGMASYNLLLLFSLWQGIFQL